MITAMGDVLREAYKRGWLTTRDGNISVRRGPNFYITPSGVRKVTVIPETIIKGRVWSTNGHDDGEEMIVMPTGTKPSGELEMHTMLQLCNFGRKARSVVHLHPTNIIAAMHAGFDLQKISSEFPEVSRYTKVGPTVPVLPVVSPELAKATFEAMTYDGSEILFDIVGQKGHGVCAIGHSPWDAFEHIERLEHICQIVLASGVKP